MLINSLAFVFFLLGFVALFYIIPQKYRWVVLLIASLVFYCSYKVSSIIYLALTLVITYLFSRWLDKLANLQFDKTLCDDPNSLKKKNDKKKKMILTIALIVDFSSLIILKYSGFFAQLSNNVLGSSFPILSFVLPMGLSFYVFQTAGYLIDIYRGKYRCQKNLAKYALFVCYFPQMIQGPINRYDAMEKQLYAGNAYDLNNIQRGLYCILFGLLKKALIADALAPAVAEIYSNYGAYPGSVSFIGSVLYCLQLYCDFSGGIDVVQGASWMFGIKMQDNFMQPYFAVSLADFWRRWHISLGEWMKDYLFFPFALSKGATKAGKIARKYLPPDVSKRIIPCVGTFIVFLVVGMWQGPGMQNIFYGLWNGFWMSLGILWSPWGAKLDKKIHYKKYKKLMLLKGIMVTNLLVVIGRYFSNASSLRSALGMLGHTIASFNISGLTFDLFAQLGLTWGIIVQVVISLGLLFVISFAKEKQVDVTRWICTRKWIIQFLILVVLFSGVVFGIYGNSNYVPISFVYENV